MNKLSFFCSALAGGCLLSLAAAPLWAESPATESLGIPFVDNGRIALTLSAGSHRIVGSPNNQIRLRWTVRGNNGQKQVDASSDVDGSSATITIDGPSKDFRTVIEVPRHSDLHVRLTAGDLYVENVVGDKDIRLRAGDLNIDVIDADDYGHVEGSLWAGDIDAAPFEISSGGLFRSIEWTGDGQHELLFKLYAGDVRLYEGQSED